VVVLVVIVAEVSVGSTVLDAGEVDVAEGTVVEASVGVVAAGSVGSTVLESGEVVVGGTVVEASVVVVEAASVGSTVLFVVDEVNAAEVVVGVIVGKGTLIDPNNSIDPPAGSRIHMEPLVDHVYSRSP
jgi:hypothetical protein